MSDAWSPVPGECLLIESGPVGKHLFVIILEVDEGGVQHFLSVPICSMEGRVNADQACVLNPGDHPFIKNNSFAEYRHARVDHVNHLVNAVKERAFVIHSPASKELIEKIMDGLPQSKFVSRHIKKLLSPNVPNC